MDAVQTVEALTARGNGTHDDALTNRIELIEPWTELIDDADGLVSQDQAWLHRILATDDVNVCSTNRRGGDADDCFACTRRRLGDLFDCNPILAFEDHRFHRAHDESFL